MTLRGGHAPGGRTHRQGAISDGTPSRQARQRSAHSALCWITSALAAVRPSGVSSRSTTCQLQRGHRGARTPASLSTLCSLMSVSLSAVRVGVLDDLPQGVAHDLGSRGPELTARLAGRMPQVVLDPDHPVTVLRTRFVRHPSTAIAACIRRTTRGRARRLRRARGSVRRPPQSRNASFDSILPPLAGGATLVHSLAVTVRLTSSPGQSLAQTSADLRSNRAIVPIAPHVRRTPHSVHVSALLSALCPLSGRPPSMET